MILCIATLTSVATGYWGFDWADSYAKVGSVYPNNATIKLSGDNDQAGPVSGLATAGVPEKYLSLSKLQASSDEHGRAMAAVSSKYPIKPKARVMVVNALSELDSPGEFYVDRSSGLLTLIPISGKALSDTDEIWVSVNDTVVTLANKTDVTLKDVTLAYARTSAVVVSSGSGILLDNLTIHNIGGVAVDVTGSDHTVQDCSISYTGMGALSIHGGDLKTLAGSGNVISGNSMTKFAQCKRTYQPAVGWGGVGHSVINNSISNAPHCGILGGGNDMLFEGNTLDHLGYEVDVRLGISHV